MHILPLFIVALIATTNVIFAEQETGIWIQVEDNSSIIEDREEIYQLLFYKRGPAQKILDHLAANQAAGFGFLYVTNIRQTHKRYRWSGAMSTCFQGDPRQFIDVGSGKALFSDRSAFVWNTALPIQPAEWDPCAEAGVAPTAQTTYRVSSGTEQG